MKKGIYTINRYGVKQYRRIRYNKKTVYVEGHGLISKNKFETINKAREKSMRQYRREKKLIEAKGLDVSIIDRPVFKTDIFKKDIRTIGKIIKTRITKNALLEKYFNKKYDIFLDSVRNRGIGGFGIDADGTQDASPTGYTADDVSKYKDRRHRRKVIARQIRRYR